MTTNPTPIRGEVWRIRFDPSEGDEIKKVRMAVVVSENAVGRLRLKIVVPITEWKPRYASFLWFVHLLPTPTDAFQVKSVSETRFLNRLGEVTPNQLDDIANAIAICVGAP
jgi:mRNA interferase MazF